MARLHQISTPGTLKGLVVVFPDLVETGDTISTIDDAGDAGLTVTAAVGAGSVVHNRTTYGAGKYVTVDIEADSGLTPGTFEWTLTYTTAAGEILTFSKQLDVVASIPIGD